MFDYLSPMLLADFYKISHRAMYPKGTELVYATWTARMSRIKGVNHVVAFGFQKFVQEFLLDFFAINFFNAGINDVKRDYKRLLKATLGVEDAPTEHVEALHKLGYLPLLIKAVPEGTLVPLRVPMLTIQNTAPEFFWVTNYIETLMSCEIWQASTSATVAHQYRQVLEQYAVYTFGDVGFVDFQGHDFSMRGMSSLSSAVSSGLGHLLSFTGTDTIPAIQATEEFYDADLEKELIGTSIPATEHSIQCAFGDDMAYLNHLITEVHPSGFVSIVADGYDFWGVMTEILPQLKAKIMARDGRVVIRPDSGDPVKIVCGDPAAPEGSPEFKGAVEVLWELFGGTRVNPSGNSGDEFEFKVLDPHIGLIYGDAITVERADEILRQLLGKGFASTNIVFGIGSFTYQYNTRDTFGFALKSTLCVINGVEKMICKNPKTDDGTKKSQRGKVVVLRSSETNDLYVCEGLPLSTEVEGDLLQPIFKDGVITRYQSFCEIRAILKGQSNAV